MLGKGTVLHQHDIHVDNDRLEKVGGDTGAADLERLNVFQLSRGFESNQMSGSRISNLGKASSCAFIYIGNLVRQILR